MWISLLRPHDTDCAVVIACNKADLKSVLTPGEIDEVSAQHWCRHFETSAVTGAGVDLLFRDVAEIVSERATASPKQAVGLRLKDTEIGQRCTAASGRRC
jgi:signal recognition particle receptor subunit beta